MTLRSLLPALLLVLAAAPASAETMVTLRSTLDVAGESIQLSDVFEGVPAEADATLARAPAPGASLTIDPQWLQQHARRSGLLWPNAGGVQRVAVRRQSRPVTPEDLVRLVRDDLALRELSDYVVTLQTEQTLHAPVDAALAPRVRGLTLDPAARTFVAEIALAEGMDTVRVTGRAEPAVALPVLSRAIARGETITAADLTYVETPVSRVPADALDSDRAIVGMAAKRALRPGVAIKTHDLERPTLIARGDVVVVRYEMGALSLTARARALADVAQGDQARFVNLQSSRVIEAVAVAPGEAWLVASNSIAVQGGRP